MASTPLELLIVVCSVCVFVAYGVVFARSLWRTNYRIDDAGTKLVVWLSESCWGCRRIQPFGEFEQFVLRRLEGQRVELAKFLLNTAGTSDKGRYTMCSYCHDRRLPFGALDELPHPD
mmetsp:Transcript_76017/g.217737  ORF Transcript_76017/g.217737 Transcript_76017/m.217737 type:complete len:118 (+) Transcript_76017:62-415(+)